MTLTRGSLLIAALACAASAQDLDIPYRTVGGVTLRMDIARPSGQGLFPAVVCLHGGGWSMGNKKSLRKVIQELASAGYVAASVQYGLAPQFHCRGQVSDVYEAIRFLRAHSSRWRVNRSQVAVMGYSAGAHLALLAGFSTDSAAPRVQAIIDVSGPTDLRDWRMQEPAERQLQSVTGKTSDRLVSDLLGQTGRSGEIVDEASPVTLVRPGLPPVLIFHWRGDVAVPMSQAERLIQALDQNNIRHEVIWFNGRGHAMNGPGAERVVPETVRFLRAMFAPSPH